MPDGPNRNPIKTCHSFKRKTNVRVPGCRGIDGSEDISRHKLGDFANARPRDMVFPQTEASLQTGREDEEMAVNRKYAVG